MVIVRFPKANTPAALPAAPQTPVARRLDTPVLGARAPLAPRAHAAALPTEATPATLTGRIARYFREHDKATAAVLMGASSLLGMANTAHAAEPSLFAGATTQEARDQIFQAKGAELEALKGKVPYTELVAKRDALLRDYTSASARAPMLRTDADKDGVSLAQELLFGSSDQKVDSDGDGLGDKHELARGLDPASAQAVGTTAVKTWTHGYIPMSKNPMIEGRSMLHYDLLMRDRTGSDPQLRHQEGASGLAKGHYFLSGTLDENDAELTAAHDFDGDGVLTPGVKWDFLTKGAGEANFGADGKKDATLNVSWWGHCNDVATAGINFREPTEAVSFDLATPFTLYKVETKHGSFQAEKVTVGATHTDLALISGQTVRLPNDAITSNTPETISQITFTPDQLKELVSELVHRGSKYGHDWVGHRFDGRPAQIELKDGTTVLGALTSSLSDRAKIKGEGTITATAFTQDVSAEVFDYATGKIETRTFKASELKRIVAEDKRDVAPIDFHTTMLKWLGSDGTAGVMDKDSGPHVWNYAFDKYEYAHTARADDPSTFDYTMKVHFVGNSYPTTYEYSLTFDATGAPVKGAWKDGSPNPDFFWRDRGGMEAFDHTGGDGTPVAYKTVLELLQKSWAAADAKAAGGPN